MICIGEVDTIFQSLEDRSIIETIQKVFEVLNLNDISTDDEIDFNFSQLLDIKGKNDDYDIKVVQDRQFDLLVFFSN